MTGGREPDGLALLDKPAGITSFEALRAVKRALGTGRVGHTGTLDKFARGLLVVFAGRFTRLAPLVTGESKCYRARVRFGEETSTLDPEGEVVATAEAPSPEVLAAAVPAFVGEIEQVPPIYSAVHHEGQRAYKLARRGEEPKLAVRKVRITSLELVSYAPPMAELVVRCSAGTYVRSLARDLGLACRSRATVVELLRTEVGPFGLAEAVAPQLFTVERLLDAAGFLPRLSGVATAVVDAAAAARIGLGVVPREGELRLAGRQPDAGRVAVFGPEERLVAVLERSAEGRLRFVAVFPDSARTD